MRHVKILSGIAALILASGTGCDRDFSNAVRPSKPGREASGLEKAVAESSNAFGFRLFAEACRREGAANVFVSPLSVSMALGMALNGAAGETESEMRATLGFGGLDLDQANAAYRGLLDLLPAADPSTVIGIANSVWIRDGFTVKSGFIEANRRTFDAEVRGLDFLAPSAVGEINAWASEKTRGRITEILDRIPENALAYLINAVFFKGTWTYAFDPKDTRNEDFIRSDGSPAACRMMRQTAGLEYLEADGFRAVTLPYGNGRFALTAFLPEGRTLDAFLAGFGAEAWDGWEGRLAKTEVTVILPKFRMELKYELSGILSSLGMPRAFEPGRADFSGILEGVDLYLSRVLHKTFVETDEKGTEAAAVTAVEVGFTSVGPEPAPVIRFDRPFAFMIRETSSGAILFAGRVEDPGA